MVGATSSEGFLVFDANEMKHITTLEKASTHKSAKTHARPAMFLWLVTLTFDLVVPK